MREIVFDTETTGFDPNKGDRITEIGCVEIIDYIPTGKTYHCYVNPQRDLPAEVTRITGLTREFLSDKPLFHEIAEEFLAFVEDSSLIAHNAGFDQKFINSELQIANLKPLDENQFKDTLVLARSRFPGSYNSLDALCKRFNISLETRGRHGALIDAKLLARVYYELSNNEHKELNFVQKKDKENNKEFKKTHSSRKIVLKPLITDKEKKDHKTVIQTLQSLLKKNQDRKVLWSDYLSKD